MNFLLSVISFLNFLWYYFLQTFFCLIYSFIIFFISFLLRGSFKLRCIRFVADVFMCCIFMLAAIRLKSRFDLEDDSVYVSNHLYSTDIYAGLFFNKNRPFYVAKKELKDIFFVGQALDSYQSALFVDRDKERSKSFLKIVKRVRRIHRPVWFFVEGTRSRTGQLLPFHLGACVLAQLSGRKICPVEIRYKFDYSYSGWPRVPNCSQIYFRKGSVLDPKNYENLEKLNEDLFDQIKSLKKEEIDSN